MKTTRQRDEVVEAKEWMKFDITVSFRLDAEVQYWREKKRRKESIEFTTDRRTVDKKRFVGKEIK